MLNYSTSGKGVNLAMSRNIWGFLLGVSGDLGKFGTTCG